MSKGCFIVVFFNDSCRSVVQISSVRLWVFFLEFIKNDLPYNEPFSSFYYKG